MSKINILLLLLLPFLYSACKKDTPPTPELPIVTTPIESDSIDYNYEVNPRHSFDFNMFREIYQSDPSENITFSPLSLSLALSMAYNGAEGVTKDEFATVLGNSSSLTEYNTANQVLIQNVSDDRDGSHASIANSMWVNKNYQLKEDFVSVNNSYYNALAYNLDFSETLLAADTINDWVAENTNNKIPKILNETASGDFAYLINTLYFKANWAEQFEESNTQDLPFTKADGTIKQHEMMEQYIKGTEYFQDSSFAAIMLPYQYFKYSMVVLLPNITSSLDNLVAELNPDNWAKWIHNMYLANVTLSLPKFKLEYKRDLKADLKSIGLNIPFEGSANFSKMTDASVSISGVLQKTFIEVNEKGTEAAAATIINFYPTSIPPSRPARTFNVNRPFVYAIIENTTGAICFLGKVSSPE